jgi:nicotinamide mononucleotide (NMN) deamidase PncC
MIVETSAVGDIVYSTVGECSGDLRALHTTTASRSPLQRAARRTDRKRTRSPSRCSNFLLEGCVGYSDEARRAASAYGRKLWSSSAQRSNAQEMAEGMRRSSGATTRWRRRHCGPDGGTEQDPSERSTSRSPARQHVVKRIHLHGERVRIREIATLHAFDMLRRKLFLDRRR